MTTVLRAGSATDVGRVRTVNQDSKLITDRLYAVADGMGGHQGGEVAAAITVEILHDSVIEPSVDSLLEAAHAANTAVFDKASQSADLRGMGTTLCAIALVEAEDGQADEIGWVSVGDSRIYLFRDGELLQLTTDHSLVEDLRRDGQLSEEEAAVHPQRNILTRALGIDPDVVIDSHTVIPYAGDRFLICSDGLFNEVSESLMAATLRRLTDPNDAAAELVRLANEHGGRDNITCVIVDVVDDGGRSQAASQAIAAAGGSSGSVASASDPTLQQPVVSASRADDDDVAGFATPARTGDGDEALWDKAVGPTQEDHLADDLSRGRVKHVTWRVVLFFVVLAVIAGGAIGAIAYLERSRYYVGYHGKQVAVFKGTPSGVLWFKPTLEESKRISQSKVTVDDDKLLRRGVERSTKSGADQYVEELRRHYEAKQASTPTTTTTTTTTTSPAVLPINPEPTTTPAPTTGALSPPP